MGVIDEAGAVDSVVKEWLTVLSRRDVALVIHLSMPDGGGNARQGVARAVRPVVGRHRTVGGPRSDQRRRALSSTEAAANDVVLAPDRAALRHGRTGAAAAGDRGHRTR